MKTDKSLSGIHMLPVDLQKEAEYAGRGSGCFVKILCVSAMMRYSHHSATTQEGGNSDVTWQTTVLVTAYRWGRRFSSAD
jgi:hypothetical protein